MCTDPDAHRNKAVRAPKAKEKSEADSAKTSR